MSSKPLEEPPIIMSHREYEKSMYKMESQGIRNAFQKCLS